MDGRAGWSFGDVLRGLDAGGGFGVGCGRSGRASFARRGGGARRWGFVGDDVHPLSQGVLDGNESTFVRDVFYLWRSGDDGGSGDQFHGDCRVMAPAGGRARSFVLVDAGRIRLGDWGFVSAICGEVCGDQPRNSAVEFEPDLGVALGRFRFRRIAWAWIFDVPASRGRFVVDDAGSRVDCIVVDHRSGAGAVETGGATRGRAIWGGGRLRGGADERTGVGWGNRTRAESVGLGVDRGGNVRVCCVWVDGAGAPDGFALGTSFDLEFG